MAEAHVNRLTGTPSSPDPFLRGSEGVRTV